MPWQRVWTFRGSGAALYLADEDETIRVRR
jgi:hypothetical protein